MFSKKYAICEDPELARILEKWDRECTPEMYNFPASQNHPKMPQARATTEPDADFLRCIKSRHPLKRGRTKDRAIPHGTRLCGTFTGAGKLNTFALRQFINHS
jgi:hypothetical protein